MRAIVADKVGLRWELRWFRHETALVSTLQELANNRVEGLPRQNLQTTQVLRDKLMFLWMDLLASFLKEGGIAGEWMSGYVWYQVPRYIVQSVYAPASISRFCF